MPTLMSELQRIHGLIDRTRRRLRVQAALERATTALVPALGLGLVALWLWRMEVVSDGTAQLVFLALGVLVFGAAAAARPLPVHVVASQLDRASGLADRLGSACEFADRLRTPRDRPHPETLALMRAAIADAVRAVPRANLQAAAPFRAPRDLRAALAFAGAFAVVGSLAFGPSGHPQGAGTPHSALARGAEQDAPIGLEEDDLAVPRDVIETLREIATQTGDLELDQLAAELEALLDKAERGLLRKEELLAAMQALENAYLKSTDGDLHATVEDLQASARELATEPLTRSLGEALLKGDMGAAQKELDRLADKLDKNELSKEQERRLADVLEKTANQHDKKQKHEDDQAKSKVAKKREEVRRLEKKAKEKPHDEHAQRRLQKERRELEKLERDTEKRREQAQKRRLERLHRDMKRSAENLRNKRAEASRSLRDMKDDAQGVEDEMRKIENRKKVASQLSDIKDSIRRARPKKGQGREGRERARAQRIREWEERAGGRPGDWKVWKPGQAQGRLPGQGTGQPGEGHPNDNPSSGAGDGHDPSALGDPTDLLTKTKDEKLSGRQGAGPSRRETILTSAKKGFATTAYQRVFAEYQKIVEDVMTREKVPLGYKYYVKRYFQRIKPHRME